jgi:NAD(P)-dependent dehydrogenase (short-subunit alcohol dehydrogenase family)
MTGHAPPDSADVQPVTRMVWHLTALPPVQLDGARLRGMRVLVLGDPRGCGQVVGELARLGARVRQAHDAASAAAGATDGVPDAIVDLTLDSADSETWRPAFLRSVAALRLCYDRWSTEAAAARLFYLAVTYLGGGMGYHAADETIQPLGGVWSGLAKTLHRELPNCNARVVDVGSVEARRLASIVVAELGWRGPVEVGYRDGRRWTLTPKPERPAPPTLALGPADLVLVSGGGRGIGWLLARDLARGHGARVVVTGREPLPSEDEPWFGMTEAELDGYHRSLWSAPGAGRTPVDVRRRIDRIRSRWRLVTNLATARREGLAIGYEACDVADPGQVKALLARLGDRVTAVVHNAGVDNAARLPKKSDDEMIRTIETKTRGFLSLFDGVRHSDLKFFCNVGSLTGRLGGMVGQLEYAAANDGLARLGQWAGRGAPFPVMTLCWPTWDRVGLIANFRASLRYMTALDVDEGLRAWQAELLAPSTGEVTFIGPLGRALDPGQVIGYPLVPQLPGYQRAFPKVFHLGDVREYRPARSMRAVVTLRRDEVPAIGDFLASGTPALPVSVLLENAVRAAEWMLPEDRADLVLSHLAEVEVPVSVLAVDGSAAVLERETAAGYRDDRWEVEIRYRRPGDEAGRVARVRVVYNSQRDDGEPGGDESHRVPATATDRRPELRWRGMVVPLESWRREPDGRLATTTRPGADDDLWVVPYPPRTALPVVALENVLREASRHQPSTVDGVITIARLSVSGAAPDGCRVVGDPARGRWRIYDARSQRPVATVDGLAG